MSPGEIERCKLRASAIDRLSTAVWTLGVFAPLAAAIYAPQQQSRDWWVYVLSVICWIFAAIALHWAAGRELRRIDQ